MQIHRIYTFSDLRNFTYLIEDGKGGSFCIDPFDAKQVCDALSKYKLRLNAIINTHEHWDHINGNEELILKFGCKSYGPPGAKALIKGLDFEVKEGFKFDIERGYLEVIDLPGHSISHIGLLLYGEVDKDKYEVSDLFSGDCLFNSGVGRCGGGGNPEVLYNTIINKISPLKDFVKLQPGHDYFENNLLFTLSIDPENKDAQILLENFKSEQVKTTEFVSDLKLERKVNCFLRTKEKKAFIELRQLRDNW